MNLSLVGSGLSNPSISLPPTLDARSFLSSNDIRYVMAENVSTDQPTISYFEAELGFTVGFQNSEWIVLQR